MALYGKENMILVPADHSYKLTCENMYSVVDGIHQGLLYRIMEEMQEQ